MQGKFMILHMLIQEKQGMVVECLLNLPLMIITYCLETRHIWGPSH